MAGLATLWALCLIAGFAAIVFGGHYGLPLALGALLVAVLMTPFHKWMTSRSSEEDEEGQR